MKVGKCTRQNDCHLTIECDGCGFQHFDKIIGANKENGSINYIGDEYFKSCQGRRGPGGRIALDTPIKNFILQIILLYILSAFQLVKLWLST